MIPGEQLVEVAVKFVVELIVFGHPGEGGFDDDAFGFADLLVEFKDAAVGQLLTVRHAELEPMAHHIAVGYHAGGDQGPEEVAFSALITTGVEREPLGIMHLVVAELGLASDLGFEDIANEVFSIFTGDDQLATLIADYVDFFPFERKERIGDVVVQPSTRTILFQALRELVHLSIIELDGVDHLFLGTFVFRNHGFLFWHVREIRAFNLAATFQDKIFRANSNLAILWHKESLCGCRNDL